MRRNWYPPCIIKGQRIVELLLVFMPVTRLPAAHSLVEWAAVRFWMSSQFPVLGFFFRDQINQRRNSWKGEGGEEKAANSILSTPSPKEEGKNLSTKDGAIEILFCLLMSFILIGRAFVMSNAMHQSISFLCTNLQKIGSNSYVHNPVFFFFFF